MQKAPALGVLLTLLAWAAQAGADEVSGLRSQRLVETAHQIHVSLAPSHATLSVLRSVWNGGSRADQATFEIELPPSAVATSLATLGSQGGRPFWFNGELMEAEAAARQYEELTGIGGFYPKDPALLSWRSQTLLLLQVFPCTPAASKWVQYSLEMPTRYEGGRYFIELPRIGSAALTASVTVAAATAGDRVLVNGTQVAANAPVQLNAEQPTRIELERAKPAWVAGELASIELGSGRALTHYRVAAAARLSELPRRARIVVVLDASTSLPATARLGMVSAARAYLSSFRDAEVEVVSFDRRLHPRHGRLVPVARALADLRALQLVPQNGSNVERALAYADLLLACEPAILPKRVVLFTDALTRSTLTTETLALSLENSHALLHVAVVQNGEFGIARDDDHAWSRFVHETGGLVWDTRVDASESPSTQARTFEAFARPKAIDHVRLTPSSDEEPESSDEQRSLAEGEASELFALLPQMNRVGTLQGELWAEPVSLQFSADEQAARRWAALVFGSPLEPELVDEERMQLARQGGAVSPVTSYLAIEPGVRPSTEGLEHDIGGMGEGIGLGSIGTLGHGGDGQLAFDQHKYLLERAREQAERCGSGERRLTIELETTRQEIVDVTRVSSGESPDATLEHCLREALWQLALPAQFQSDHVSFKLGVRAGSRWPRNHAEVTSAVPISL